MSASAVPPFCSRFSQRGIAVVTALLLTTLAVTIVASLFWQQQVQIRSIENQRMQLQKSWVMRGAMDWASLILRTGGRQSLVDHLDQPWATPLVDTRLDQYIDDGRSSAEVVDAGGAVLSGHIIDAQSRYNLNNLSANGLVNPEELEIFKRLLDNLHVPVSVATVVAQAIAAGQPVTIPLIASGQQTRHAEVEILPILQPDDLLSLPNFTLDMLRQVKDFVVVLPVPTPINVNTAPAEVLAACFGKLSVADAQILVSSRRGTPFVDMQQVLARVTQLFATQSPVTANVGVSSNFFLVNSKISLGRAALNTVSLIQRTNNRTGTSILWIREQ
ncbi:type II secretion system minor pseudopilin GspK [Glaciimonas immobilis]|uniref:Type II secretion system protein K n=1 Tax=Glaciimonas immobilis TaxID=728004 RepID=A0A840RU09_9BURK|nr:type II secretion system minor pseudopilin GspK [Glaciimonas immobilis]KAF3998455.1 type II secretion system minor pseudopilin GspK [Glaciimonas immobilis]MBB5202047.1 general secretion pathway protein K [Glaciimonas immobilis]